MSVELEFRRAIRFVDGAPDVTGLPCDLISGSSGEYMRRYHLELGGARSIRFHKILADDPGSDLHDHPWDFVSVMLAGSYSEVTPGGIVRYDAPCVIVRKAEDLHRLVVEDGPVWTYVVTGRVRRRWGFDTPGGWVWWREYAGKSAVAACDPPSAVKLREPLAKRYGSPRGRW